MDNLRAELQKILDEAERDGRKVNDEDVLEIAKKFDSSISFIETGALNIRCFGYALGLKNFNGESLESWVVGEIISDGLLKIDSVGKIIIYRNDDGDIKHAGIIDDDQVVSKWGGGSVWRHDVFDVPSSYGKNKERYTITNFKEMETKFHSYFVEDESAETTTSGGMETWYNQKEL